MITENEINENKYPLRFSSSRISMIGGYLFFLLLMILIGKILFTSSDEIRTWEEQLSFQIIRLGQAFSDPSEREKVFGDIDSLIQESSLMNLPANDGSPGQILSVNREIGGEDYETRFAALKDIISWTADYERTQNRSLKILFSSFVGMSLILLIIIGISEYDSTRKYMNEKYAREMDRKLVNLLEEEKNMISLELHDDVAQKLTVIKGILNSPHRSGEYELASKYTDDVIQRVRSLSQELRTPDLIDSSLPEALNYLYSDYRSISDIELQVTHHGLSAMNPDPQQQLHIYRIIQELLTNSWKHSNAGIVHLNLTCSHPVLLIRYKDDGIGMDNFKQGLGLSGIRQRIGIMKGRFSIVDNGQRGTEIVVEISLEE